MNGHRPIKSISPHASKPHTCGVLLSRSSSKGILSQEVLSWGVWAADRLSNKKAAWNVRTSYQRMPAASFAVDCTTNNFYLTVTSPALPYNTRWRICIISLRSYTHCVQDVVWDRTEWRNLITCKMRARPLANLRAFSEKSSIVLCILILAHADDAAPASGVAQRADGYVSRML